MARVDGKVALVTGGGGGIGRATARRLADEGAAVVVTDLRAAEAGATAEEIGGNALALAQDVRDEADWRRVIADVQARHGRLDILVNNAGILATENSQNVENTEMTHQLTKSVAVYCARAGYGIRCNSVHPGLIDTDMGTQVMGLDGADVEASKAARRQMVPVGELGVAEHVANCILFLASDEAAYVTGAELVVDGGLTAI